MPAPQQLERLVHAGLDQLPPPGSGSTLQRWQVLSAVAAHDLSLAKLFEGHTDALAILGELEGAPSEAPMSFVAADRSPACWGVWAAEVPNHRVRIEAGVHDGPEVRLHGSKAWCSGALTGSDALLTAWPDGETRHPQLVAVRLSQPQISVSDSDWHAIGMRASASVRVSFDGAVARRVGQAGDYLTRAGFWQGGAGIAACWYGGAQYLAEAVQRALAKASESRKSGFSYAAAGKIDVTLQHTANLLRQSAQWIDRHPQADARAVALRARLAAVACGEVVLREAAHALGPAAFCADAGFARAAADLPVFMGQSHGEGDYAALGEWVCAQEAGQWKL